MSDEKDRGAERREFEIPAAPGDFVPVVAGGAPHALQQAIFPIVKGRGGRCHVVGTCFAVGPHLLLTAAHCVDDVASDWPDIFGAVYIGGVHENGDLMGGLLHINRISVNPESDVALLQVALPANEQGEPLAHHALPLTLAPPSVDEVCTAFGYTVGTEFESDDETAIVTLVSPQLNASTGQVEAVFMEGRGEVFPYPAFQVAARYDHQMSGCPIIGSASGRVVGVVSTGALVEDGMTPYGTGSLLWPAMGLAAFVTMENGPADVPLIEVAHTLLNVDESLSMVSVDTSHSGAWVISIRPDDRI